MDIAEKLKPLKATYLSLSLKNKIGIFITLLSLLSFVVPHAAYASQLKQDEYKPAPLVFVVGERIAYLDTLSLQLSKLYERRQMQADLDRQLELGRRVKKFLQDQGSPLAEYATTLIQLNNWKKIVALSNAESGMCKHYPEGKANCWGIGGSNLWYMGSNLREGIITMNSFLNEYPNRSSVKYAQMTFRQMNGLYKQPPAQHWVDNNEIIYNQLTAIENSL